MPYGGAGGSNQAAPDGGRLLSDAAAAPVDADGVAGDFHLRRDNGLLTGPKLEVAETLRTNTGFEAVTGLTAARLVRRIKITEEVVVAGMTLTPANGNGTDCRYVILSTDDRSIIAESASFDPVTGDVPVRADFPELVTLTPDEYYVGFRINNTSGSFRKGTVPTYPDAKLVASTESAHQYLRWTSISSTFTDNPNTNSSSDTILQIDLNLDSVISTWDGADTRTM